MAEERQEEETGRRRMVDRIVGLGSEGLAGPIESMYGIFTYIYHKNAPNVGKYTIHGFYGGG